MTTTDTATEPETRTDEEWAVLFAAARAYVPVPAMTSDARLKVAKFDKEQAAQVARYQDEYAIRAEEWDHNEALRRRQWDVPSPLLLYGEQHPGVTPASLPGPLPRRDPGATLPALAAAPVAEALPELPPAQEAALERFTAAHDAEDAEPGTAVIDLDGDK